MSDSIAAQLDALAAFPAQIGQQLRQLSDAQLHFRPAPGEWSALEVLGHMIDVGALWPGRTRQMLASENPALAAVDADWVRQRDYHNKQVEFLLQTLAEQRAEYVEFLRSLRPGQLARTGIHPTRGPLSVADGVAALADHDRIHSQQIAGNLAAYEPRNAS